MICHFCKKEAAVEGKVTRKDLCPHCKSPLHVCLNCRFHDRSAHNECREPVAEWVRDKGKENFCEYFEPACKTSSGGDDVARAKEMLDKLFG